MLTAKPPVFGGHETICTVCNNKIYSYNSCGDANCPQCQNIKKQLWIDKMCHHLLPVKHFHLIFTLPHELNDLIFYNKKRMYGLLFEVANQTLKEILGGKTGMIATLHSWGSNLSFHPHLHCIVPAGSYKNDVWKESNPTNPRCFCNASQLREKFKEIFLKKLLEVIELEDLNWKGESIEDVEIFSKIR